MHSDSESQLQKSCFKAWKKTTTVVRRWVVWGLRRSLLLAHLSTILQLLPRCSENQFLRLCRVNRATVIAAAKTGKRVVRVSCLLQQIWLNKSYHFSSHSRSRRWQADQWSCGWCRALRDFFVAFPIRSFPMSMFMWVLYQFNSFQTFYDFTTLISESLQRPVL